MSAHSRLGPSGASRWSNCPGSVALLEAHPQPSSKFAEEGTKAHHLCELELMKRLEGKGYQPLGYDQDMIDHCMGYADYCEGLAVSPSHDEYFIEGKVHASSIHKDVWGTCDFACWDEFGLDIVDFKYGQGIPVKAERNTQLMIYAVGAIDTHNLDVSEVTLHVYQPRVEDGITSWTVSMDDLRVFADGMRKVALAADCTAERIPGKWCRFCAKQHCPEWRSHLEQEALVKLDDVEQPEINVAGSETDRLVRMLSMEKQVQSLFNDVRNELQHRAESGEPVKGHKLIRKLGNRAWKDEETVVSSCRKLGVKKADMYKTSVLSYAQLKKLVDKAKHKLLDDLVHRPDKGLQLVSESAKGDPVDPNAFQDVELLD